MNLNIYHHPDHKTNLKIDKILDLVLINQIKLKNIMTDLTGLNSAVQGIQSSIDSAVLLIQDLKNQGVDQATIDSITEALNTAASKLNAARV